MIRATVSLPAPLSPSSNTGWRRDAILAIKRPSLIILGDWPTMLPSSGYPVPAAWSDFSDISFSTQLIGRSVLVSKVLLQGAKFTGETDLGGFLKKNFRIRKNDIQRRPPENNVAEKPLTSYSRRAKVT